MIRYSPLNSLKEGSWVSEEETNLTEKDCL